MRIVDEEKYEEAIPLLKSGVAMEPQNRHYVYELPFAMKVYEPGMLLAALFSGGAFNMNRLAGLRKSFLKNYYKQKLHKEYPNELLAYQQSVTEAGHADAYHRWILMKGDEGPSANGCVRTSQLGIDL